MKKGLAVLGMALTLGTANISKATTPNGIGSSSIKSELEITLSSTQSNVPIDKVLDELGILNGYENRWDLVELLYKAGLISFSTNKSSKEDINGHGNSYIGEATQNKKLELYFKNNASKIKENAQFINESLKLYRQLVNQYFASRDYEESTFNSMVYNNPELLNRIAKLKKILSDN